MTDPYKILNISENASDEEVRKAYRELAKKYHPDKYANSPLAEQASEKMKEINAAYEQIIEERKNNTSPDSRRADYAKAERQRKDAQKKSYYYHIRSMMKEGRNNEAETLLQKVSPINREAEWFFLMALISLDKGHLEEANNYIETACNMEPYQQEYNEFFHYVKAKRRGTEDVLKSKFKIKDKTACCDDKICNCCDLGVFGIGWCVSCGVCFHCFCG